MINTELTRKINSEHASDIFVKLYGQHEIESARKRYVSLINAMADEFQAEELKNASGDLRIFTSPGRTELAGNHTDHNRGKVLAASIQLDNAAVVQKRSDNIIFFRSAGFPDVKVKLTDASGSPDLKPKPEEMGTTEALIRGIAAELNRRFSSLKKEKSENDFFIGGFSANAESTVLPGSGLSSSAAVEVLIGRVLDSLYGDVLRSEASCEKLSPLEIAQIGQYAENVYFGKPCGLMDQAACSTGGVTAIDFENADHPVVKQINFDLSAVGYALCVVNTGGSHADLTADYASIPAEMKSVAAFFGKQVLRELDKTTVLSRAAEIRKALGDRALLRAIHFFDENARVDKMTNILLEMESAKRDYEKHTAFYRYLKLVDESGDSSWKLLQNVFSPNNPASQGITAALALTKDFLSNQSYKGSCRVHGGGFAGTIQTYIPLDAIDSYRTCIEAVFGAGTVTPLRIRPAGAVELIF